jgi:6-phosphogluconolactonase
MDMAPIEALKFALAFVGIVMVVGNCASAAEDSAAGRGKCLVYIGTYTDTPAGSKGIYVYQMDPATGSLTPLGVAAETVNPTFLDLSPDHRFLYAANEIGNFENKSAGAASAFAIDRATGKLTLLNQASTVGAGPCHLVLDKKGRNVLVANYGGGSAAVLPVDDDGKLGKATAFIQHQGRSVHPERQLEPHSHCLDLDKNNRFAFVCDLGLDKVMIYRFDPKKGTLMSNDAAAFASVEAGAGPRHMVFSRDDRYAYVINELKPLITVFGYDAKRGVLKELQTVRDLPEDFKGENSGAEIELHPTGRFLYASNRGHDSIAVFTVDPKKGTLMLVQLQSTQGKTPRHFGIDPTGKFLLAANQDSNNVVVFQIDETNGRLKPAGCEITVPAPVCVKYLMSR